MDENLEKVLDVKHWSEGMMVQIYRVVFVGGQGIPPMVGEQSIFPRFLNKSPTALQHKYHPVDIYIL